MAKKTYCKNKKKIVLYCVKASWILKFLFSPFYGEEMEMVLNFSAFQLIV